ncbi:MAG: CBS domain-containing protein [Pelagimonas sp.]|jgi:CBS domain-containing protein|nr:CBS domain-containing protein [Pelagimonas sp.]
MLITSIGHLLEGRSLISVSPDATVEDACLLFDSNRIGALAVVGQGQLLGILCERDVIRRCLAQRLPASQTKVANVMTPNPVSVHLADGLAKAQSIMDEGGFRHLPVVEDDNLAVGMISVRDIPTDYKVMAERFREYSGKDPV